MANIAGLCVSGGRSIQATGAVNESPNVAGGRSGGRIAVAVVALLQCGSGVGAGERVSVKGPCHAR